MTIFGAIFWIKPEWTLDTLLYEAFQDESPELLCIVHVVGSRFVTSMLHRTDHNFYPLLTGPVRVLP